ncbi:hypothetical protein [Deinococcus navajonensis]|uniref:Uncharacterized protein n=1 Tax=Deinococcus navajonensis TaxID=309884 RepID=A0ABV8XNJ3_9DEIO
MLTATQLQALTGQAGFIRYLRDLPEREYHFGKMGPPGWKALAESDPETDQPDLIQVRARRRFFAGYNIPELQSPVPRQAARELLRAIHAGRAPNWVLALTPDHQDLKDKAGDWKNDATQ